MDSSQIEVTLGGWKNPREYFWTTRPATQNFLGGLFFTQNPTQVGLLIPQRETRNEEFHDEEFLARKRRQGKNEEK